MTLVASFRQQAFLEYTAARRWYEKQRAGLGVEFETEFDRAIARACAAPRRYVKVLPEVHRIRLHRFPFVIYYRMRGDKLIVLAVFHSRRDPAVWRSRS